jgi:hypothetical protein
LCVKSALAGQELASKFNVGCVSHLTEFGEYPLLTKPPDKNDSLHVFQMESCVMSEPKLGFEMWGIRLNAEGVFAIVAAIVLVALVLAFYRF